MLTDNQKGFTLTELIAALTLSTIIFIGFTLFMLQSIAQFKEIKEYNILQDDVMNLFDYMKRGKVEAQLNENDYLIGIETAEKINIRNSKSIELRPYQFNPYDTNRAIYSMDTKGRVILNSVYNSMLNRDKVVFPSSDELIDRDYKYRLLDMQISNVSPYKNGLTNLIKVKVVAQVRFRERQNNQSILDDQRMNVKNVTFETIIYASNVKNSEDL